MHDQQGMAVTVFRWKSASPHGPVDVELRFPRPGQGATRAEVAAWELWRTGVVTRELVDFPAMKEPR